MFSVEFGDDILGIRQVDFVLPSIFTFGPAFPFNEEDDFVAEYFGFTNGFDFPLGFSFDDVRRGFRVVWSFGVLMIRFDFGYVEDGVDIFPLLGKRETISVGSDPFSDLERSRAFLGELPRGSVDRQVSVIQKNLLSNTILGCGETMAIVETFHVLSSLFEGDFGILLNCLKVFDEVLDGGVWGVNPG